MLVVGGAGCLSVLGRFDFMIVAKCFPCQAVCLPLPLHVLRLSPWWKL